MSSEDMKAEMAERLPAMREEYAKLGKLIAATEEFLGEAALEDKEGEAGSTPPAQHQRRYGGVRRTVGKDDFVGMSTSQAVKAYLTFMGKGNPQGPRDMAKALVAGGRDSDEEKAYANVTSVLKRLNKNEEIKQVRRGQWGLAAWYGNSAPKKGE